MKNANVEAFRSRVMKAKKIEFIPYSEDVKIQECSDYSCSGSLACAEEIDLIWAEEYVHKENIVERYNESGGFSDYGRKFTRTIQGEWFRVQAYWNHDGDCRRYKITIHVKPDTESILRDVIKEEEQKQKVAKKKAARLFFQQVKSECLHLVSEKTFKEILDTQCASVSRLKDFCELYNILRIVGDVSKLPCVRARMPEEIRSVYLPLPVIQEFSEAMSESLTYYRSSEVGNRFEDSIPNGLCHRPFEGLFNVG